MKKWKMKMTFGIASKIAKIEENIRTLDRRMLREELRTKQLLIMFKMILDKSHNPHRSKKLQVKMKDIIGFMDMLVKKNLSDEPVDLLSELIKSGME